MASGEIVELGKRGTSTLDPAHLEREVARLWAESSQQDGAEGRTRSCLATLVVRVTGPETPAWLDTMVGELPSRVIVVHELPDAEPSAWVTARCVRRPGESTWVCIEAIHLATCRGEDRRIAGTVRALAVGGVSLVVVIPEISPLAVEWVASLGSEVDLMLGDSSVLSVEETAQLWRRSAAPGPPAVRDIQWTRLREWRTAIASIFDGPEGAGALADLASLSVTTGGGPGGRHAAWLLLGWLASRLGWRPLGVEGDSVRFDAGGRPVAARLSEVPAAGRGLLSVGFVFGGGRAPVTWRLLVEEEALVVDENPRRRRRMGKGDVAVSVAREARVPALDRVAGNAGEMAAVLLESAARGKRS